jgi:hypothetical protein
MRPAVQKWNDPCFNGRDTRECFVFLGRYAPHRSTYETSKTRARPCHQEHKLAAKWRSRRSVNPTKMWDALATLTIRPKILTCSN